MSSPSRHLACPDRKPGFACWDKGGNVWRMLSSGTCVSFCARESPARSGGAPEDQVARSHWERYTVPGAEEAQKSLAGFPAWFAGFAR